MWYCNSFYSTKTLPWTFPVDGQTSSEDNLCRDDRWSAIFQFLWRMSLSLAGHPPTLPPPINWLANSHPIIDNMPDHHQSLMILPWTYLHGKKPQPQCAGNSTHRIARCQIFYIDKTWNLLLPPFKVPSFPHEPWHFATLLTNDMNHNLVVFPKCYQCQWIWPIPKFGTFPMNICREIKCQSWSLWNPISTTFPSIVHWIDQHPPPLLKSPTPSTTLAH